MDVDSGCRGLGVVRAANDVKPQVAVNGWLIALDTVDGSCPLDVFNAGCGAVNQAHASLHKRDIGFQLPFTDRIHLFHTLDGNEGINLVGRNTDNSLMPEF